MKLFGCIPVVIDPTMPPGAFRFQKGRGEAMRLPMPSEIGEQNCTGWTDGPCSSAVQCARAAYEAVAKALEEMADQYESQQLAIAAYQVRQAIGEGKP